MFRLIFCICLTVATAGLSAATLESAKVTAAVNKVLIAPPDQSPKPAAVGDVLGGKASLETGQASRAELTFNDETIARVGANSVFSFYRGTRELELNQGVIFMQVPKNAGGATIQTAAVTAAITGTTIGIEYPPKKGESRGAVNSPKKGKASGPVKILVLEGTLRVFLKSRPGESLLLEAGQMLVLKPDAKSLPEPQNFDIGRLVRTSKLLGAPFSPLASMPLITANIVRQEGAKRAGTLIISNYVLQAQIPGGVANFQQNNSATTLMSLVVPAPTPAPAKPASVNLPPAHPVSTPISFRPHPTPHPTPYPTPPPGGTTGGTTKP